MPAPLLRRSAPARYFHPIFLIFQSPPSLAEVINISSPPTPPPHPHLKKGGSKLCRYIFSFLKSVYRRRRSMKVIWGQPLNVSISYLYFSRTILHNKLKIWEMQAHQSENSPEKYFMLIHLWFYFLIFFFCGNLKICLSIFRQTNLMK